MTHNWVKSSYSSQDGGNCIEWAPYTQAHEAGIPVRDSKHPTGPVLLLSPEAWTGLVEFAKHAEA
ncbi:DUF397 domain-containing protein [Streptomyces sp. NPDC088116]|uniref:DUF397 domain-containing protein n=1 Tax=Streptomyces sp. NPDC088116 TaxID=3365825 RepID=UPI003823AC5E